MVITCCILSVLVVFFFFQAEDGIRDLVRSRGLGDVYKRQIFAHLHVGAQAGDALDFVARLKDQFLAMRHHQGAVSYTHLTLPTSDLV